MSKVFNDISLVMFSTTVGHHGFKDIYKYTLNHLDKNYGLVNFGGRYAAIKVHNNDEDLFCEMVKYFKTFNILKEIGSGNLADNPQANQTEYQRYMTNSYARSIANMFSWFQFETKYILWVEDDCLIMSDGKYEEYFQKAKEYLDANPDVFSIHMDGSDFPLPNDDLFGPTKYAFRPHLMRTERMIQVANCFKGSYNIVRNMHPEMVYELAVGYTYPGSRFVKWNPKFIFQEHLGQSDFLQLKEKFKLEIN